jgi:hypothetical protein
VVRKVISAQKIRNRKPLFAFQLQLKNLKPRFFGAVHKEPLFLDDNLARLGKMRSV